MKTIAVAILGTSSIVASADAGFMGFVAFATQRGSNVVVDVFTAVSNSSDKFLNVYNANVTTSSAGGFVQQGGIGSPPGAGSRTAPDSRAHGIPSIAS
jgi:hypothetical protein